MSPFSAVSADQMREMQIITAVATALFVGIGVVPGVRPYAGRIRLILLVAYLATSIGFVGWVLLR